jgi:hypothetical protein
MRVFKNRVLGKIFWPKREEVKKETVGDCIVSRLMISIPLFGQFSDKRMRWMGHEACVGEKRNTLRG